MAFTETQKATKLATLDKRIAKLEAAGDTLGFLRAEREWLSSAPTVPDRVRKPRKPRTAKPGDKTVHAEAASVAAVVPS